MNINIHVYAGDSRHDIGGSICHTKADSLADRLTEPRNVNGANFWECEHLCVRVCATVRCFIKRTTCVKLWIVADGDESSRLPEHCDAVATPLATTTASLVAVTTPPSQMELPSITHAHTNGG